MDPMKVRELFVAPIDLMSGAGMSTRHPLAMFMSTTIMEMIQEGLVEITTPASPNEPQLLKLTTGGLKWYNGYLHGRLASLKEENEKLVAGGEVLEQEATSRGMVAFKKVAVGAKFRLDRNGTMYEKVGATEEDNARILLDVDHQVCSIPEDSLVFLP